MSVRQRYHYTTLRCDHRQEHPTDRSASKPAGYCDDCWRAALARGLTTEEWSEINGAAAVQPLGSPLKRRAALPLAPKAAKPWNGSAVETIRAAIEKRTSENDRRRCQALCQQGAHGYVIGATDGHSMICTPGAPVKDHGLAAYLDPARYATWITLPAGVDLVMQRVAICACEDTYKGLTWTVTGDRLTIAVENRSDGWQASEWIPLETPAAVPITICLSSTLLRPVLRGGLELGLPRDTFAPILLRPADDSWRYVQMGMRI